MDKINSLIFPHVLDIISQSPNSCETIDNLCESVRKVMTKEETGRRMSHDALCKAVKKTVDMGQGLGIFTVEEEEEEDIHPTKTNTMRGRSRQNLSSRVRRNRITENKSDRSRSRSQRSSSSSR
ncbi:uncharacterized protein LOC142224399 [Haematobia irritans]|uniref:uncharacterized protein LOC142224399 n=1 Tax=Haematobia irritans TaxID=7368 RepID=UPI003F4F4D46